MSTSNSRKKLSAGAKAGISIAVLAALGGAAVGAVFLYKKWYPMPEQPKAGKQYRIQQAPAAGASKHAPKMCWTFRGTIGKDRIVLAPPNPKSEQQLFSIEAVKDAPANTAQLQFLGAATDTRTINTGTPPCAWLAVTANADTNGMALLFHCDGNNAALFTWVPVAGKKHTYTLTTAQSEGKLVTNNACTTTIMDCGIGLAPAHSALSQQEWQFIPA